MLKYNLLIILFCLSFKLFSQEDKFLWLEDVDAEKSLEFVNKKNVEAIEKLSKEVGYQSIYEKNLEIYNSNEKIAYPSQNGNYVYNYWKDKVHERGIWRRCLLKNYTNKKYNWETLIDVDELSKIDNKKWVFKGSVGLFPDFKRFLVSLSNGGGDAIIVKEFDTEKKQFIENGFNIDESKSSAEYVNENTLIVGSNFGEGTLTTSGYPKQVKLWNRGTLLKDAQMIYNGNTSDVGVNGGVLKDGSKSYILITRYVTTFTSQYFIWKKNNLIKLDLPEDCSIKEIHKNEIIVHLKSDWKLGEKTFQSGTLLSLNFTQLLKGIKNIHTIVVPDKFSSLSESFVKTKNHLVINLLKNVTSHLYSYSFNNGKWNKQKIKSTNLGTIYTVTADAFSDKFFFTFENFINPTTLYYANASTNKVKQIKSLPAYFNASKYIVKQFKAQSKDGTLVPFFMVSSKNIKYDGNNPTLINGYGGFEISNEPYYLSAAGNAWLDKGGVNIIANLRGGGEYGPKWHQGGIKEKRQNVFDDLYAISEYLIEKKITSSKHLGIIGGSNGGLLVGVAFTQRPSLYNAVVCAVPILDMQRYHKLLAGASWMGEYGNPDLPEEWEYIKKYSPYHNLKLGEKYPEVFFTSSTRDDRVHPGHARKMVAKMDNLGYKTIYFENTEGGHAGASTNEQSAKITALIYSYLIMKLK